MPDGAQHLQPHEDVEGKDLGEGHLLARDDTSIARRLDLLKRARERLDGLAYWRAADRLALDRMRNPQAGDLVVELTTRFQGDPDTYVLASGLLLVHEREEWACTDADWARTVAEERANHEEAGLTFDAAEFARGRFTDRATYIQYGVSATDICRWSNCRFVAVPEDLYTQSAQAQR